MPANPNYAAQAIARRKAAVGAPKPQLRSGLQQVVDAVKGTVVSRVNRYKADSALTSKLNDDIGSPTIIGQKNYDKQYGVIKNLIKQNKQEEAVKYSRAQAAKVRLQSR